jgi:hypothetical protein
MKMRWRRKLRHYRSDDRNSEALVNFNETRRRNTSEASPLIECRGRVVNIHALYTGGPRFKSRPGDRTS